MERFDYLVVGGGVCGTTAAETIRKLAPDASVAIVSREPHRLYSRILLAHLVLGKAPVERIFLRKEDHYAEKGISFLAGVDVLKLRPADREVALSDGRELSYGKLIVATGADPLPLGIPGADKRGVFGFRTLEDAQAIRSALEAGEGRGKEAVVVGSSFIGLEFPQFFERYGWSGHLAIRGGRVWHRVLDEQGSGMVEHELVAHGMEIHKGAVPVACGGGDEVNGLRLSDGTIIEAGFVGYGVGLSGAPRFALEAGLEGGPQGIHVDPSLRTRAPDIWAVGDAAAYEDARTGLRTRPASWLVAQEQGRHAAEAATGGEPKPFDIVPSYSLSVFSLPLSFVGDLATREGSSWISRGSAVEGSLARLHLRDGKLAGAAFVGAAPGRNSIVALVKSRTAIGHAIRELADAAFDPASLIS